MCRASAGAETAETAETAASAFASGTDADTGGWPVETIAEQILT